MFSELQTAGDKANGNKGTGNVVYQGQAAHLDLPPLEVEQHNLCTV